MADFMDMLRFGPQNTMQPAEDAPSIYAGAEEWEAYRLRRQQEDLDIMQAMDLRDADSARLMKTAENLQRPVTGRQPAPIEPQSPMGINATQPSKFNAAADLQSMAAPQMRTGPKHAREDAINANTGAYGVQAFTDEKGQLVLTNKAGATDAKSAMSGFKPGDKTLQGNPAFYAAPGGAVAPDTPANVNALFKTLQSAKGFDDAAAVYSTLTNALAASKAEMLNSAMQFAEQKAGIPQLKKSLEQNIYLDSQKRGGVPGVDSPITTQIRRQLDAATQRVDTIARGYLATNVNYATLESTEKQAQLYMQQAQKKGDMENQLRASLQIRQEAADAAEKAEETRFASVMPDYTKDRLRMLNPALVTEAETQGPAAYAKVWKMVQKDKNMVVAVSEPPEKLPILAFKGNPYAMDIVAAQEAQATGRSKESVKQEFDSMRMRFAGPDGQNLMAEEMALIAQTAPKDRKTELEKNKLTLGQEKNSPEKADTFAERQAMLALNWAKRTATDRFLQNAAGWPVADQEFQTAVQEAVKVTGGRASVNDVLAAYNGNRTGKDAVERHKQFLRFAELAAAKKQSALFGAPDSLQLQAVIQASLKDKIGVLNRMGTASNTGFGAPSLNPFTFGQEFFGNLISSPVRFDNVPSISE